jgi:Spy/CpxP family protein refolding chaperone
MPYHRMRTARKEVITSADFDENEARSLGKKITAVIQDATINRLQLRNDLYQQLTSEQERQYSEIVQSCVVQMLKQQRAVLTQAHVVQL